MKLFLALFLACTLTVFGQPFVNLQLNAPTTEIAINYPNWSVIKLPANKTIDLSSGTVVFASNQVPWTAVNKTVSSLADLATRSAADLTSGTLAYVRVPIGTTANTVAAGDDSRIVGALSASVAAATYVLLTRTITTASPLLGGGNLSGNLSLSVSTANATQAGALLAADYATFAAKQPAGSYLTNLTGDIVANGPGSATATLATVNTNVGTFGNATTLPSITVSGKGLTTAVSNVTITPALSSITGLGANVATFLATPTSANLLAAMPGANSTGTGANVFGTSPTFNTNIITPSIVAPATTNLNIAGGSSGASLVLPQGAGQAGRLVSTADNTGVIIVPNGNATTAYSISGGNWGAQFGIDAVPFFQAFQNNMPGVLDVLEHGNSTIGSWADIGTDYTVDGVNGEFTELRKAHNGLGVLRVKGLGTGNTSRGLLIQPNASGASTGDVYIGGDASNINSPAANISATGNLIVLSNATSNSTSTGSLRVSGGAGIVGNLNTGGNIVVTSNASVGGSLTVTGAVGTSASITAGSYLKTATYTVSSLPSASGAGPGAIAFVTDSTTTVILGLGLTPTGGGSNKVPVYSDGTNWIQY